jgi:hypothetical protein
VEELDAAGVDADVVRGPAAAELLAAGGELTDQDGEVPVVGVAAGFRAQDRDGVVGDLVVGAEELGGVRVEEDETGVVRRAAGLGVDRCVERLPEVVGGQDVETTLSTRAGAPVMESMMRWTVGRTR